MKTSKVSNPKIRENVMLSGNRIKGIDKVFLIDSCLHDVFECSVLYLIDDNPACCLDSFYNKIEEFLEKEGIQRISFILRKTSEVYQHIADASIYYVNICKKEHLVFAKNQAELFFPVSSIDENEVKKWALDSFNTCNEAPDFLCGARFYSERSNYKMSAFMLQQTTEQILRSFLIAIHGHLIPRMSIYSLIRYTLFVSNKISAVFTPQSLGIINIAYQGNRLDCNFTIDKKELDLLFSCVQKLQKVTPKVLKQIVTEFKL